MILMSSHIQITFTDIQQEQQEWTIAHLAEAGFEGFEEKENELIAYIPEKDFDERFLNELAFKYQLNYHKEQIPEQNWNELWESNFPPVIIDDFVAVRADFHPPTTGVKYEILITPKMSFGTGHHATTSMMIEQMRDLDFRDKQVFDFGTGTGILAILAEKLGAKSVLAADNDDWSVENAKENIQKNNCRRVEMRKMDSLDDDSTYDVILANINKNVIVDQFEKMVSHLHKNGSLILSGLLTDDKNDILEIALRNNLHLHNNKVRGHWLSMRFDR